MEVLHVAHQAQGKLGAEENVVFWAGALQNRPERCRRAPAIRYDGGVRTSGSTWSPVTPAAAGGPSLPFRPW
jgi:hypothetical protein